MTERPSGRPNCSSMYISSDTFSNSQGIETASYLLLMIELVFQHSSKRDRKFDLLSHLLLGKLPLSEVHLQSLAHRLHVQPLASLWSFWSRAHNHEHYKWKHSFLVFHFKELMRIWMLQNPTGSTSRQMVMVGTKPWTLFMKIFSFGFGTNTDQQGLTLCKWWWWGSLFQHLVFWIFWIKRIDWAKSNRVYLSAGGDGGKVFSIKVLIDSGLLIHEANGPPLLSPTLQNATDSTSLQIVMVGKSSSVTSLAVVVIVVNTGLSTQPM